MSQRTLSFEVANAKFENGLFSVTLLPTGDDRFLNCAFHFRDLKIGFDDSGIDTSYLLEVDLKSRLLPTVITPEKQKEIEDFGNKLIKKFFIDQMNLIDRDLIETTI